MIRRRERKRHEYRGQAVCAELPQRAGAATSDAYIGACDELVHVFAKAYEPYIQALLRVDLQDALKLALAALMDHAVAEAQKLWRKLHGKRVDKARPLRAAQKNDPLKRRAQSRRLKKNISDRISKRRFFIGAIKRARKWSQQAIEPPANGVLLVDKKRHARKDRRDGCRRRAVSAHADERADAVLL